MACDKLSFLNENAGKLCEAIDLAFRSFKEKIRDNFCNNEYNKLYFNIACAFYKNYWNRDFRVNLYTIRKYLQRSIEDNYDGNFRNIEPAHIKQTKYLLQASCDLYFDIDEKSDISDIHSTAVVLEKALLGYNCYYIENGKWLVDESNRRIKSFLSGVSIDGLKYNQNSKIFLRTKDNYRQLEIISLKAQHKRGQLCIDSEYYQLKRKCKKLKKEILDAIKANKEVTPQQAGFLVSIKGFVQSVFKKDAKDFFERFTQLMIHLIDTYLQLGFINKVDEYLNLFELMADVNSKLSEVYLDLKIKRNNICCINKLLEAHENLINFESNQNDVQQFVICRPENNEEGQERALKLKEKLISMNNSSVLFTEYLDINSNSIWKTVLIYGDGRIMEKTLNHSVTSVILKYLNKTTHKRVPKYFHTIFTELLNDENMFDKPIQSSNRKLIEQYTNIKEIYEKIGHTPLKERYENAIIYLQDETNDLKKSFINYFGLTDIGKSVEVTEDKTDKETKTKKKRVEIGLFSTNSITFTHQLNDKMSEKEFFNNTMPNIDKFTDFHNTFNNVYDLDILVCSNPQGKEQLLQKWLNEYSKLKECVPYQKKYLLILVECDLVYQKIVDASVSTKIENNAIVIENKTDNEGKYSIYFAKNGLWIKSKRTGKIKSLKSYMLQKDDPLIENLSNKYQLRRWYIYCEEENGRAYQGFLEHMETFRPVAKSLKEFQLSYLQDEALLNAKKAEILKMIEEKLKQTDYKTLKPRKDQFIISSKEKTIQIFNISRPYDQMNLKSKILSNDSYACVVKFSSNHYIALVSEMKFIEKNEWKTHINILNSNKANSEHLKKLNWLESNLNDCQYRLNSVECPAEQPNANNSFLHAYINAAASKWALENNLWSFLKRNFYRQNFSNSRNIEILKKNSLNLLTSITEIENFEEKITLSENLRRFEEAFKEFYKMYVKRLKFGENFDDQNLKHIEQMLNIVDQIESFQGINDFLDSFKEYKIKKEEFEEKKKVVKDCIKLIEVENAEIDILSEMIFKTIRISTVEIFEQKNKLLQILQYFEKKIHEFLLLSIGENKEQLNYTNNYSSKINDIINKSNSNKIFNHCMRFFETLSKIDISSKVFNEIKELSQNICTIFEQYEQDDFDDIFISSFEKIKTVVKRFYEVEIALNNLLTLFSDLLPFCFELMELKEINVQIKRDIYDVIANAKDNFDDILKCISNIISKTKTHESFQVNSRVNLLKVSAWPVKLNELVKARDELSIYTIGILMREKIVQNLEFYLNSLVKFRYESTIQFEKFEKELNKHLIKSIKDSAVIDQLEKAYNHFPERQNLTYTDFINIYAKVANEFILNAEPSLNESIQALLKQLRINNHSHVVYLSQKFTYLKNLVFGFYEITKILPNLCEKYLVCLAARYDNLTNEEAFDEKTGKLNTEILQKFKNGENFEDIKKILSVFDNKELMKLIIRVEKVIPSGNIAALMGVAWCFREILFNKTKEYTNDLLDFRHTAFRCFDKFEKDFFKFLSDYDQVRNSNLRISMEIHLNSVVSLGEFTKHKKDAFISTYLTVINQLNNEWCKELRNILNECQSHLNPYWNLIANNLRNLLNNFVNWIEIEKIHQQAFDIYQIKTTSSILSEIIDRLTSQYIDCFASNNEIRIINTTNLFVDTDLTDEKYTGMKISIVSQTIKLVKGKIKFTVNVNGKDAKDVWLNKKAKDEHGHDKNGNGNAGKDGSDGKPGSSAGHVYIVSNQLPDIDVFAKGGKGGSGQDGGDGARGKDGENGKDGSRKEIEDYFKNNASRSKWNSWAHRVRRIGTDGERGGHGGDAGAGGFCGDPGDGGQVKLISLNDRDIENYKDRDGKINTICGKSGKPGK